MATGSGPYPTGSGPYPMGSGPYPTGSGPYQRPATGPTPQADRRMPPSAYPDNAGGRQPDRQGQPYAGPGGTDGQRWPNAGNDGSWYPEEPQWDGGFPETDPNLRYREPGPGMPGYRGSRENRYGGDRY